MTTLITGGRGFVGRHIIERLLDDGHDVVSYNRDFSTDPRRGVTAVQGELADITRLIAVLRDHAVDRIIHTAGQSHPGVSIDLPWTTFQANAEGTLAVYECARATGVTRVVNFSSECALGNCEPGGLIVESCQPRPTTTYGVTKVTGEMLGDVYNSLYGMEIVSLRVTEVYGPGLWMPSLLGDMIRAGIDGLEFRLDEGGDHQFQFVYVDDVAHAACLAATTTTLRQHIYNVSGGVQITVNGLARQLEKQLPDARYAIGPGFIPQWDRQSRFDLSAAQRDLGYTPAWSLEAGLAQQIDWLRSASR